MHAKIGPAFMGVEQRGGMRGKTLPALSKQAHNGIPFPFICKFCFSFAICFVETSKLFLAFFLVVSF